MSYNENLATQAFVNESIEKLIKPINNPDEALETGIYKVVEDNKLVGADNYILIVQEAENGQAHIKQTKLMADGALYSREFDIFEPPFPAFTQSTASQNDMALFKIMVDSQFATIEDELERQRIITSAEGESIVLPDSADAALRGLKVMGKTEQFKTNGYQLFDAKNMDFTSQHYVSVSKLDNGAIRVTKTKTGSHLYASGKILNLAEFIGKTLYISSYATASAAVTGGKNGIAISYGNSTTGTTKSMKSVICDTTTTPTKLSLSITPTVADSENYDIIRIVLYENATPDPVGSVGDYVDFSDIMISTKDVAYEPYTGAVPAPNVNYPQPLESIGDDGSVDVNVHGYQLFDASAIDGKEANGVTVTNNGDGSFAITGISTSGFSITADLSHKETIRLLKVGNITLSNNGVYGYPYAYMSLLGTNGKYFEVNTKSATYKTKTITQEMLDDESLTMRIGIHIKNNNTTVTYLKPMLYQDGDGTWEPFKPIQTLNIPTPNGLPAVPVSSDGNYTDASGQQWSCDEVDFDREVYVQRTETQILTGEEANISISPTQLGTDGFTRFDISIAYRAPARGNACLCNYYPYKGVNPSTGTGVWVYNDGASTPRFFCRILEKCSTVDEFRTTLAEKYASGNPVTIRYPIATPIETPLSAEEIAAYKALRTHYPNTSIHNSDNAHMVVDYVADTKNYVDNQIKKEVAELTAAILTQ